MNNPVLYAKCNPFQARDAKIVLKTFGQDLAASSETDTILDIGCGSGNVTRHILAPNCGSYRKLIGVDISKEMVDYARQQCDVDDIDYEVLDIAGDVRNFRSFWGGFSKVFSFYCLHWVKDHRRALENIEYLLTPGGECLLVFVAQCPVFEMYEKLTNNSRWQDYMQDADNFVPSTQHSPQPAFHFTQLMEDAGLTVITCEALDMSFTFSSLTMLRDCMCAVNPFVSRIPSEEKSDYVTDCLRTLASMKSSEQHTNQNEGHNFTYKLLVAHAKKV